MPKRTVFGVGAGGQRTMTCQVSSEERAEQLLLTLYLTVPTTVSPNPRNSLARQIRDFSRVNERPTPVTHAGEASGLSDYRPKNRQLTRKISPSVQVQFIPVRRPCSVGRPKLWIEDAIAADGMPRR